MMPLRICPGEISELALFFLLEGNCERPTTKKVPVHFANLRQGRVICAGTLPEEVLADRKAFIGTTSTNTET